MAHQLNPPSSERGYDAAFFEQHRKHAGAFLGLAEVLVQPGYLELEHTVLDVGCGHGLLVEALRARGVAEAYCIEGSPAAAGMWPPGLRDKYYVIKDLTATDAVSAVRPADVIVTFEVRPTYHFQNEL